MRKHYKTLYEVTHFLNCVRFSNYVQNNKVRHDLFYPETKLLSFHSERVKPSRLLLNNQKPQNGTFQMGLIVAIVLAHIMRWCGPDGSTHWRKLRLCQPHVGIPVRARMFSLHYTEDSRHSSSMCENPTVLLQEHGGQLARVLTYVGLRSQRS